MDQKTPKGLILTEARLASFRFGFLGTVFGFGIPIFNCIYSIIFQSGFFSFIGILPDNLLGILLPGVLGLFIGTTIGALIDLNNESSNKQAKPIGKSFYAMVGTFLGINPGFLLGVKLTDSCFSFFYNHQWRDTLPFLTNLFLPFVFAFVIALSCLGGWWGYWVANRRVTKEFTSQD